jgi:hypothetical protein
MTTNGKEGTTEIRTQDCLLRNYEMFRNAIHFYLRAELNSQGSMPDSA